MLFFLVSFSLSCIISSKVYPGEDFLDINWWGLGVKYCDSPALGWQMFTFFIFLFLLIYLVKDSFLVYLTNRINNFTALVKKANKALTLARQENSKCLNKLNLLSIDMNVINEHYITRSEANKWKIIESADILGKRMMKEARNSIQYEATSSRKELVHSFIVRVISHSRVVIKKKINSIHGVKLHNDFICHFPRIGD